MLAILHAKGNDVDKLRATFVVGQTAGLAAQDVFADRLSEIEAFCQSIARMEQQHADSHSRPASDLRAGRRNALVYYGIGGIGKTALSKQLEHRLEKDLLDYQLPKCRVTARIDLGESGDFDLEANLLRIRARFSEVHRSWPAFDLAFQLYWQRTHPGESIPDFIRNNSALRHYAKSIEFADQMQETLREVLFQLGMAWTPSRIAVQLATITHEHFMRSATYRKLHNTCPFFDAIVGADESLQALSYMPCLLEWQLEHRKQRYIAAIFLDTFEAIGGRNTRDAERLIQRLVFLMPSVLFVITGRNRLDWADSASADDLDYVGRARWPQLDLQNQDLEPRQHLIGALSPADCDLYLRSALQNADGTPALADSVRQRIIDGSDGLPLYLDLSVTQYMELQATGQPVTADVFGGPLSSVVSRVMRNLDEEERNLLRGTSLLDSFDIDLAHAASGSADAKIVRFVNSALVTVTLGQAWPYTLHAQLRRAIQDTDHDLRDAWSPREWREAADRICSHLGRLTVTASRDRDRAMVAACFIQAVRLAGFYESVPRWVLDAAQFLADAGLWQALDVRLSGSAQYSPAAIALNRGLRGISLRRSGSLETSIEEFDAALSSSALQADASGLLKLHRAHSLRNSGRYDDAQEEYRLLAEEAGPYAGRARLQLADLHYLRGQFRSALEILDGLGEEDDQDALGESIRIRGHVYRANCQFDMAELNYRRALELGRQINSPALEGKALTNIAETLCWRNASEGKSYAEDAINFNLNISNQLEVLKAYVAKAICCREAEAEEAIVEALRLVDESKYRAGAVFALSARVFQQLLSGNAGARSTAEQIIDITSSINTYYYWTEIVGWWLTARAADASAIDRKLRPGIHADWLGHPVQARHRWVTVLNERSENNE